MQGINPDDSERMDLARTALDFGKRLDPGNPAIGELEQLLKPTQR